MTREQIELLCKNIQACTGDWQPEESILLKHDAEQRRQIIKLSEALQLLHDYQNGCPLPSYEEGWTRAMALTEEALKDHP